MSDRQNKLEFLFDMKSPRIAAYHIHEWIFEPLQLEENDLYVIQIDGPKRHVYINFKNTDKFQHILQESDAQYDYRHENGKNLKVQTELAGMGIRTVRIANFPPEVSDRAIVNIVSRYGEVKEVKEERWSKSYLYKIANGIRLVTLNRRLHTSSYLIIANNKVLLSYEGQPMTCYGCSNTGHLYNECPARLNRAQRQVHPRRPLGPQ
jgi:hypothetical protein